MKVSILKFRLLQIFLLEPFERDYKKEAAKVLTELPEDTPQPKEYKNYKGLLSKLIKFVMISISKIIWKSYNL